MVYPALLPLMRTPRLPVVDWTDAPADWNGLVHLAERRNLVYARVPSHFNWPLRWMYAMKGQGGRGSTRACIFSTAIHCCSSLLLFITIGRCDECWHTTDRILSVGPSDVIFWRHLSAVRESKSKVGCYPFYLPVLTTFSPLEALLCLRKHSACVHTHTHTHTHAMIFILAHFSALESHVFIRAVESVNISNVGQNGGQNSTHFSDSPSVLARWKQIRRRRDVWPKRNCCS